MHKKLTLSIAMAVVGAGLLVASSFAGAASASAPTKSGSSEAKRGGTLRINALEHRLRVHRSGDGLRRRSAGRCSTRSTRRCSTTRTSRRPRARGSCRRSQPASRGSRVTARRTRSRSARGSSSATAPPLTAARVQAGDRAGRRPEAGVSGDRVHPRHRRRRRAQRGQGRIGHRRHGQGPDADDQAHPCQPDVPRRAGDAVLRRRQAEHADRPEGRQRLPVGRVRTGSSAVTSPVADARAEPELQGQPPGEPDRIVYTVNTDQNQSLLQVRAGQADYDAARRAADGSCRPRARSTASRRAAPAAYFVNSYLGLGYVALNNSRAPFSQPERPQGRELRHRPPAMIRVSGKFYGKRTDQILPPGMPGFRRRRSTRSRAPIRRGRSRSPAAASNTITLIHTTSALRTAQAQVLKYNLEQMGLKVHDEAAAVRGCALQTVGTQGSGLRRVRRRLGRRLPGSVRLHQRAPGRQQHPGVEQLELRVLQQREVQQADERRAEAYRADARYTDLRQARRRDHAPRRSWAPFANPNSREFISDRVTNYIHHPVYSGAIVNALAIK